MIIAGFDPGLAATGYGIIKSVGNRITPLEWGVIRSGTDSLPERLDKIYRKLQEVIKTHQPELIGVEEIFFGKNPRSALLLGHARGVILLAAKQSQCPIYEYPARVVKQAVVGRGGAQKEQVKYMVRHILGLGETKLASDASDALAVALCCLMRDGGNHT